MINHVLVRRGLSFVGYGVWISRYLGPGNQLQVAKPMELEWEDREECFTLGRPTLILQEDQLKAFAEGLVESDVLPEALIRNERELKAVNAHLQDFRSLAFHALKVPKEKP